MKNQARTEKISQKNNTIKRLTYMYISLNDIQSRHQEKNNTYLPQTQFLLPN